MSEPGPRGHVVLASPGRAADAGHLGAADIELVTSALGVDHRLVGGNAVSVLVAHHGAADLVPGRETADADVGAAPRS